MALAAKTARLALGTSLIDAQYLADRVIFINNDIIAINKPYGLPVHSGPGVKICVMDLLDEFTEIKKLGQKPELAHRLDRFAHAFGKGGCQFDGNDEAGLSKDCSGTLLFTRSQSAAKRVAEMFTDRIVRKQYWAITVGVPSFEEGEINIPVGETKLFGGHRIVTRRDLVGKSPEILKAAGFKNAVTRFQVLDTNKTTCALLQLEPLTGLKQQIRVHVAEGLKCPILGDHKFSSDAREPQVLPLRLLQLLRFQGVKSKTDPNAKGKIRPWQRALIPLHLHARQLILPQFDKGKDIIISAPPPEYFQETLEKLSLHPKKKNMILSRHEAEYLRLRRLGKSTKRLVGF